MGCTCKCPLPLPPFNPRPHRSTWNGGKVYTHLLAKLLAPARHDVEGKIVQKYDGFISSIPAIVS